MQLKFHQLINKSFNYFLIKSKLFFAILGMERRRNGQRDSENFDEYRYFATASRVSGTPGKKKNLSTFGIGVEDERENGWERKRNFAVGIPELPFSVL